MHMSSSSEAAYAWKMARTYGPEICRLDRAGRITWAQEEIARLKREHDDEWKGHERQCEQCRSGKFCLDVFTTTKEQRERWDMIHRLEGMIDSEQRDHEYAERAYARGVSYKDQVDTFNRYWCNVSFRRFCIAGWKCAYKNLGYEEVDDLQALCRKCHKNAHGR
jgi:hypothetical protein